MVTYETIKKDIFKGEGYGTVLSKIINEPSNKKVIEDSGCVFESLNAAVRALSKSSVPAMEIASPIENFISHTKTNAADVSAADMLFILLVTMPNHELLDNLLVDSGSSIDEVLKLMEKTVSSDLYNTVMGQYNKVKAEIEESEGFDLSSLTDLTAQVASEPVKFIGREDIIDQTILILNRKLKHNVLHVGEPGVGKTACTLGLAQKIVNGDVPDNLKGMKVYSLDVASLIAGSSIRGAMEEALINVLDFVSREPSILYIDEIHTISGTGSTMGSSMDIANILKPYLSNGGSLRIIGATTNAEYRKRIESDKALARRFQVVPIQEPSVADTIAILKGLKPDFEKYHKVKYSTKVLTEAVELSAKYVRNKFLPDKAIDIIDLAGSKKSLAGEKAVDVSTIRQMVEEMSGMPIGKQVDEGDKLKSLEVNIGNRVFGQDEAVKEIVRCVKLSKAGLNEDNKPIASFLFVGPTGVGKTEVAKALADELDVALLRFDMSEYADKMAVSKFVGASAGYVGYEDGGLLVNKVRDNPYSVLLLDEIEKADPSIFNTLLQVMDNATLTDNKGNVADFRNIVIIMTSNAGARDIKKKGLGFNTPSVQVDKSAMDNAVKAVFTPEFRGRLTSVVAFREINVEMAERIAGKQLNILSEKLKKKKVTVSFDDTLLKAIAASSNYEQSGGRALVSTVDEKIKPLFVDELLFGRLKNGGKVKIKAIDNVYSLEISAKY